MDRLHAVRIRGFRAIEDLEVPLRGLMVLVGENGTGKSTFIEALELLSKAGHSASFVRDVLSAHGRPMELFRQGANSLRLDVEINTTDNDAGLHFEFELLAGPDRTWSLISNERVWGGSTEQGDYLSRNLGTTEAIDFSGKARSLAVEDDQLALKAASSAGHEALRRVETALRSIRVHSAFDTLPGWLAFEQKRPPGMRTPVTYEPVDRLARLGANLPNAFNTLKNRDTAVWQAVLDDVRSGLGADVVDVQVQAVGRGVSDVAVKFAGLPEPIFSAGLSDGQLAYLGFVALRHLDESASLVAFDEPETHLHPALLARVVWLFEELAKDRPVVLATHSDALLNMLSNPVEQVRVCRLDAQRRMRLERLDASRFERFSRDFGGIGDLRREGLLSSVVAEEAAP
jgi:predicted ATPase